MIFRSTEIGTGSATTPTVVLVGRIASKYSPYTRLNAAKSRSMFVRKTVTSTTFVSELPASSRIAFRFSMHARV
jgi:hypothetical protein